MKRVLVPSEVMTAAIAAVDGLAAAIGAVIVTAIATVAAEVRAGRSLLPVWSIVIPNDEVRNPYSTACASVK